MIKGKVFTKSLTLANATPAALRNTPVVTPTEYKTVRGFYIIRNSGTDYLKIGINDASGNTIMEPVNITHLTVGNTVAIKDKFFKETPFKAGGTTFSVSIENFGNTTGIQDTDLVFICDNED